MEEAISADNVEICVVYRTERSGKGRVRLGGKGLSAFHLNELPGRQFSKLSGRLAFLVRGKSSFPILDVRTLET